MDRHTQLVYEGARTFPEVGLTVEIVMVNLQEYGLFEVLSRDQNSQCELSTLYLRSCIIEQRMKEINADICNSFSYILERLSVKKNLTEFPNLYVMEYVPACFDIEAGPDKTRLNQLICDNPYRCGPPPPYQENVAEPLCFQVKTRFHAHINDDVKKAVWRPKSFSYMTHKLSALFISSVSPKAGDSLQTEVHDQCGPHVVETKGAGKAQAARNLAHRILSRLVTAPDTSGEASIDAENCHAPVTSIQLAAYFTAKGPQDGDSLRCGPYCPSPPRCLSSVPVFPSEVSLPEEGDFCENSIIDSARHKPKSSRVHSIVPRLNFDNFTSEIKTGLTLQRRSLQIEVAPFEE